MAPLDARTVVRWFDKPIEGAALRPIGFHDLRHSPATLMLARGVPARVVVDLLGHADMSMVTTYQHVLPDLQREAANRFGGVPEEHEVIELDCHQLCRVSSARMHQEWVDSSSKRWCARRESNPLPCGPEQPVSVRRGFPGVRWQSAGIGCRRRWTGSVAVGAAL
ncbi:MAG: tyrosine-type recombinase/integrase [Candidatus Dormibacteraceae bacterium]